LLVVELVIESKKNRNQNKSLTGKWLRLWEAKRVKKHKRNKILKF